MMHRCLLKRQCHRLLEIFLNEHLSGLVHQHMFHDPPEQPRVTNTILYIHTKGSVPHEIQADVIKNCCALRLLVKQSAILS